MPTWTEFFDTHINDLRRTCEDMRTLRGLDRVAWTQYLADRAGLSIVTVWNFRMHPKRNFTVETLRAIDRAVSEMGQSI